MNADRIQERLFPMRDEAYRTFLAKLIPTVRPETIIGVGTPMLRACAKELSKQPDVDEFLGAVPHAWFEENQLHAFILSEMKEYERCIEAVEAFLPWVDNWATCDQMSPKVFRKHRQQLLARIKGWLSSDHEYTVRFAIGMLMAHFLDGEFDPEYLKMVAGVRSGAYYVNMMIAWYFATALAKQYDAALPLIEHRALDDWTHNKAIQKSLESNRVAPEQKEHLKNLKVTGKSRNRIGEG